MKRVASFLFLAVLSGAVSAETSTVTVSEFQNRFAGVIHDYADQYDKAPNELKKSALVKRRVDAISSIPGSSKKIDGWYGTVEKMGTNGDGDAYLAVRPLLAADVSFGTWNNSFSDIGSGTLIKNGTPLFDSVSDLEEGVVVMFSGVLGDSKNMTENGKMTEPDFLFKFTKIEKIGERVAR